MTFVKGDLVCLAWDSEAVAIVLEGNPITKMTRENRVWIRFICAAAGWDPDASAGYIVELAPNELLLLARSPALINS